ncbi:DUF3278 domain-containing protein [Lactobacillus panisapium]|uniref:DUF3278 domain-containing protein n=1 Tax=Lactobacillus panisapium TaxID=2012495 RepID=UPI001C699260|nr:DUF3278 domain-containing protein [Lactobacillus panisapium]QYN53903.1 DUF3278 domain-containing protein [Lactobacillus panisapium]
MEKKTSLFFRYMKYWYGIYGPLDEYKRSEVERIGNNAFFITFLPMNFVMILAIVVDNLQIAYKTTLAYIIMLFGWFMLELTTNFYISHQLKKLKLQIYEVENNQVANIKKKIWTTSWISGLFFGVLMTAVTNLITHQDLTSFYTLFEFLLFTAVMALANGFERTRHVKLVEDED